MNKDIVGNLMEKILYIGHFIDIVLVIGQKWIWMSYN
jgi:hypothetical protein